MSIVVVVLDGRGKTFGMKSVELFKLDKVLPRYRNDIPYGSLVLVGYVPSIYSEDTLGCSFCWVVVLATPKVPKPISSKSNKPSSSKV
jgi:hypothetical protein